MSFFKKIDVVSCVSWAIETQILKMFAIGEDWISCNRTNESGNDLRKIYDHEILYWYCRIQETIELMSIL